MKHLNKIKNIIYTLTIILVTVLAGLIIAGQFGIGNIRALVVQSGSMEPQISTGSVVFVMPSTTYNKGDIITFHFKEKQNDTLITHRIKDIKNNGQVFVTQGDNNNAKDPYETDKSLVVGKVFFHVSLLGYFVSAAKHPIGFSLMVIVPAVLLIYSEIKNIIKVITSGKKVDPNPTALILVAGILLTANLHCIGFTKSYFSDEVTISNNTITAGVWTSPAEEPEVKTVVINEIMWMGSDESTDDEWIELRNMTDKPINVGKWELTNVTSTGGTRKLMIPANRTIPANGYLLIARLNNNTPKSDLKAQVDVVEGDISLLDSGNGNISLLDDKGHIIDSAKGDVWPAGENGTQKKSMERNEVPGDGLDQNSWHTCEDVRCNDGTYWKTADGNNFGTPKAANLSENDPTSPDFKPQAILSSALPSHSEETNVENEHMNADNTSDQPNIDQSLQEQKESTVSANTDEPEDLDQHNTDPNTTQPETSLDTPTIPEETNVETVENMQNTESEETPSEQTTTEKQSDIKPEENVPIHQETETQDS